MSDHSDPDALAARLVRPERGLPPVGDWNPPLSGELDMRIARDGSWHYQGSPIARHALTRLFSTVLRRDADGQHYLVTPVEKWRIRVDDAPFVAVALQVTGRDEEQRLTFLTNVGDRVTADADHPLRVDTDATSGEPSPYVRVRGRLDALVGRAVYFELVELGGVRPDAAGSHEFGTWSGGCFFILGSLGD